MIAIDTSTMVGAAIRRDSVPERVLLALAAGATIIVSSDADLLALDPWRGVRILRPADYLAQTGE